MDGDEVAQIYIKNPNDPEGPIKALKAFLRVHVKAGDSQEVNIELTPEAFHSFNDNTQTMEVRPGKCRRSPDNPEKPAAFYLFHNPMHYAS